MPTLTELLAGVEAKEIRNGEDREVSSLSLDSRTIQKGALFAALPGTVVDGHDFIGMVVEKGAVAIVCARLPERLDPAVAYVLVEDAEKALAEIASAFYGHPSSKMSLVGITGTNGKTTVATLLYQAFSALGHPSGLLSTVENRIRDEAVPASHTTPNSIELNALLAKMLEAGCTHAFMEVSSHAVEQGRVHGLSFAGGIFTNLTQDHLDYHQTMEAYAAAKQKFFTALPDTAFGLSNLDDPHGKDMFRFAEAQKHYYSLEDSTADFYAPLLSSTFGGVILGIPGEDLSAPLVGRFNAYNVLAVYAAGILLGEKKDALLEALKGIKAPAGRFQTVRGPEGRIALIDYAHTPDALENVLRTVSELRQEGQHVITVVGCGGNRDKGKRPIMARIARDLSDAVFLTSDNPRNEDPAAILEDMKRGADGDARAVLDRREAIQEAIQTSRPGDIILIAGKGHETYQEIRGERFHFDDREEAEEAFRGILSV